MNDLLPVLAQREQEARAAAAKNMSKEKSYKDMSMEETLAAFGVTQESGLSEEQVQRQLEEWGPNALPEIKKNKCLKFLSFMSNPLSWVMESAALVAIILSNGPTPWLCYDPTSSYCLTHNEPPDWEDFVGIVCLLLLNSIIGFYEEEQAGAAVDALMDQLSREYKVKRAGQWTTAPGKELVPGDIVSIKLGDVIPADCKLLAGEPLKVDQAALTGESLPVTRGPGQDVYSGTTVKQGEIEAVVTATGAHTFSGKASDTCVWMGIG